MSNEKEQAAEMKTYAGSCHCGNVKFSIQHAPSTTVFACNCSICSRNSCLWIFPAANDHLTIESGENILETYEFGRKTIKHKFCPKCGSSIMAKREDAPEGRSIEINARMLHDFKLDSLHTTSFDGAALEPFYHTPQASSSLVAKDGSKIYDGNCHCGAITYSVLSEPLTETGPPVCECDCSICSRNGYLWIYPLFADVKIHGVDALTDYIFGQKSVHRFCSICGISMFNDLQDPKLNVRPVNVRTLNGLDVKGLNIVRNYVPSVTRFKD